MAEKEYLVLLGLVSWQDAQTISGGLTEGSRVVGIANSAAELQERAEQIEPDVVLFSPRLPGMTGELIHQLLHRERGEPIAAIGIFPSGGRDEADRYYGFDMGGHLYEPVDASTLTELARLIPEVVFKAKQMRQSRDYIPLPRDLRAEMQASGWRKRGIAFWGIGGGVGKSSLALNVAAALGILGQRPTLLLDLDMSRGALASYQGVRDRSKNIFPLVSLLTAEYNRQGRAACTPDLLRRYTERLGGKLDLLPGVAEPQIAGLPEFVEDAARTQAIIESILDVALKQWDFVVIDLGPDVNHPVHFAALQWAEDVFTIIRPNISDIDSTAKVIPALRRAFGQSYGKFHLVVNQWREEAGISLKDVVSIITDMPLEMTIPWDPKATYLLNRQAFLVLQDEIGPAVDAIVTLAAGLFPPLKPIWERRGGHIGGQGKVKSRRVERRKDRKGWLGKVLRGEA